MAEKKDGMTGAINWREQIGTIAGPFEGNRKSWLARAARRANVSQRQIKALFYGEMTDPRVSIASQVLTAAELARAEGTKRDAIKVAEFLHRHAQALATSSEDKHEPKINALLTVARLISGRDSA